MMTNDTGIFTTAKFINFYKNMKKQKTHILWNPNKNYLGHWDIPSNNLILTIKTIAWEPVENYNKPIKEGRKIVGYETENKRIVRFIEDVKPMICNEENAQAITMATGVEYIEDFEGKNKKIELFTIDGRWFGEDRKAIRVKEKAPKIKTKIKLTPAHEKWAVVKQQVEDGKPVEYFLDWFDIDEETKNLLIKTT